MTANELYAYAHKRNKMHIHGSIFELVNGFSHLPEYIHDYQIDFDQVFDKIVVREIDFHNVDGYERYVKLSAVWFDDVPVMIIQNAGRGGHDHCEQYITNMEQHEKMIAYIKERCYKPFSAPAIDPDTNLACLTEFYGYEFIPDNL